MSQPLPRKIIAALSAPIFESNPQSPTPEVFAAQVAGTAAGAIAIGGIALIALMAIFKKKR